MIGALESSWSHPHFLAFEIPLLILIGYERHSLMRSSHVDLRAGGTMTQTLLHRADEVCVCVCVIGG